MFDYKELKLQIKRVFDTQDAFAEAMGMSKTALNLRLNCKVWWKNCEIYKACNLLGIPIHDSEIYFFKQKV